MKIILILAVVLTISSWFRASGQVEQTSVLWSVTTPDKKVQSYLLGTIHLIDTMKIGFPIAEIGKLVSQCKLYVNEVAEDDFKDFMKRGFDTSWVLNKHRYKTIKNSLDKPHLAQLKEISNSFKMFKGFYSKVDALTPQAVALFVMVEKQINSPLFQNSNFAPDKYFEKYAMNHGIEVVGMESAQSQFEALFNPNIEFDDAIIELQIAIDYYLSNQSDIFIDWANQDLSKYKNMAKSTWMVKRNKEMVIRLSKWMSENSTFCAVGVAHLVGDNGLLALLKEQGFLVSPLVINIVAINNY